jgi:hypothetical protein
VPSFAWRLLVGTARPWKTATPPPQKTAPPSLSFHLADLEVTENRFPPPISHGGAPPCILMAVWAIYVLEASAHLQFLHQHIHILRSSFFSLTQAPNSQRVLGPLDVLDTSPCNDFLLCKDSRSSSLPAASIYDFTNIIPPLNACICPPSLLTTIFSS